jgi:predicted phosphohydrolase
LHDELALPDGDVLVHAGDFTDAGSLEEIRVFGEWFARQPHSHRVVVAGNHEFAFQEDPAAARAALGDVHYLEDSGVSLEGIRIWGSPWQPDFGRWAFMLPRGDLLRDKWQRIPQETDVLITHTPPQGYGDSVPGFGPVGCADLLGRLGVVRPHVHVFGHIHEGYGSFELGSTRLINASTCDASYRAVNAPIVFDLPSGYLTPWGRER